MSRVDTISFPPVFRNEFILDLRDLRDAKIKLKIHGVYGEISKFLTYLLILL